MGFQPQPITTFGTQQVPTVFPLRTPLTGCTIEEVQQIATSNGFARTATRANVFSKATGGGVATVRIEAVAPPAGDPRLAKAATLGKVLPDKTTPAFFKEWVFAADLNSYLVKFQPAAACFDDGGALIATISALPQPPKEIWLDGATLMKSPVNGPAFLPFPWRGVLHTTEGDTLGGAIGEFRKTNDWPHLTIDPNTSEIVQHFSLMSGARSLEAHGAVTNAARAIQIEIVGWAKDSPTWDTDRLDFIRSVIQQVERLVPIPHQSGLTFLDLAAHNKTPNRMTVSQWTTFSGWCGHQHVPKNTHWDPGAIDIDALLEI